MSGDIKGESSFLSWACREGRQGSPDGRSLDEAPGGQGLVSLPKVYRNGSRTLPPFGSQIKFRQRMVEGPREGSDPFDGHRVGVWGLPRRRHWNERNRTCTTTVLGTSRG